MLLYLPALNHWPHFEPTGAHSVGWLLTIHWHGSRCKAHTNSGMILGVFGQEALGWCPQCVIWKMRVGSPLEGHRHKTGNLSLMKGLEISPLKCKTQKNHIYFFTNRLKRYRDRLFYTGWWDLKRNDGRRGIWVLKNGENLSIWVKGRKDIQGRNISLMFNYSLILNPSIPLYLLFALIPLVCTNIRYNLPSWRCRRWLARKGNLYLMRRDLHFLLLPLSICSFAAWAIETEQNVRARNCSCFTKLGRWKLSSGQLDSRDLEDKGENKTS